MTVPAQDRFTFSTGNGVTTTFPYTFMIPGTVDDPQFLVYLVEIATGTRTDLTVDVDYSISGLGVEAGGVVTYPLSGAPLPATHRIVIESNMPYEQQTDVYNSGTLYLNAIEDQLDNTIRLIQQLQDRVSRTFSAGIGFSGNFELFPVANKLIGWNAAGTALENKDEPSDLLAAMQILADEVEADRLEVLAALASANLPNTLTPNTLLVDNAAGTAREAKTFSYVKDIMNIGTISPMDLEFGALGGTNDDQAAIQAAMNYGAANARKVIMHETMRAGGELQFESNLVIEWLSGAWLMQTGFSNSGSFFENLDPNSSSANSIVRNIQLINAQLDAALYPAAIQLEVVSSTATTVTFTAAASAVDDYYVGTMLEDTSGSNGGGLRIITDYVGATRTATHTTAWAVNPSAGGILLNGWNDNGGGLAAGGYNVTIDGGIVKNYKAEIMVPSATGGKAWNFEQGVTFSRFMNLYAEDCGTNLFIQGLDGVFVNGEKKRAVGIQVQNIAAKNVGSFITIAGVNSSASPDGDSDDSMISVIGGVFENAGHSPWRIVSSDQQKSGIINFLEAQNVLISDIIGRNDNSYPASYPTDFASRCGYGLTGSVGALFWGHGRNLYGKRIVYNGNVDNGWVVRRGRALGDDAGPTGAPRNCFNWDFSEITILGVINEHVIRIDPNPTFQVAANELTGTISVAVNGGFVLGGLIDPNMASFSGITLTIRDYVGGKTVIGTPAQIYAAGNTFASFGSGVTDLRVKSLQNTSVQGQKRILANNTATSFTPPKPHGILAITSSSSLLNVLVAFRTTGGAQCVCIGTEPVGFTADNTDGVLTGTTGAAGEFTVRCNAANKLIYIENQRGGTIDVFTTFLG